MSRRGAASVIVLAVLLAISVAGLVKLHADRTVLLKTFERYASLAPGPPPLGPQETQRIVTALEDARSKVAGRDYRGALQALEDVEAPARVATAPRGEGPRPGRGGGPGEPRLPGFGAAERAGESPLNITPEALEFLRQHEELGRKAMRITGLGRMRKEQGRDVSRGREAFARAMAAAERGDPEAVDRLLDEAVEALGGFPAGMRQGRGPGGGRGGERGRPGRQGPGGRSPFDQIMGRLTEAIERAEKQGHDVSRLRQLMSQLRQAGRAEDEARARQLIAQAAQELRKYEGGQARPGGRRPTGARRPPTGRRPPGRAGPGRPGFARERPERQMAGPLYALQNALMTMRAEQGLLGSIGEHLFNAKRSLREHNQEQVSDILTEAQGDLQDINSGRVRLAALSSRPPERPGGRERPRGPGEGPPRMGPPGFPGMGPVNFLPYKPEEAEQELIAFLDEVHAMSDIEYSAAREDLPRELLERIRAEPFPTEPEPTEPEVAITRAATEEQVRARLLLAEEPFKERQARGEDVSEVAEKLAEARKLLYEREYERAIALANEALEMLGVSVEAIMNRDQASDVVEEGANRREEPEPS